MEPRTEPESRKLSGRWNALLDSLRRYGRIAVAYSGGVDSTLLLYAANQALDGGDALGIIVANRAQPEEETREAEELAKDLKMHTITVALDPFDIEAFRTNDVLRCYHCKRKVFEAIFGVARGEGFERVADGTVRDDQVNDYRPGLAATEELGVLHPLADLEFGKDEVRALAAALSLPNASRPSQACLATRFPYNTDLSPELFDRVTRAEAFLRTQGFGQVRVRVHGDVARIELEPHEAPRLVNNESLRALVIREIKDRGFLHVALDLSGYRTGSMNEGVPEAEEKQNR